MEFPVKPEFFPCVRHTQDDKQRYRASSEYAVQVLRKLVHDDKWKRVSGDQRGVTIGKVHCIEERGPEHGGARACQIMCATVFTAAAVSEVLEAIASPVTDDYRKAMAFIYEDRFLDGVCLHSVAVPSSTTANALTTIKWAAFKDDHALKQTSLTAKTDGGMVDYCFLEHVGMQRDTEGNNDDATKVFGFCIQESIVREREVPVMTGFGLRRGELHRTGIIVLPTGRAGIVQISSIYQMDTARLPKNVLDKIMTRRVAAVTRIALYLDRRRLSRMQFIARENWVKDEHRRTCALCMKLFALRRKHHCRNCGEVVCSMCAPPREVDVSEYGVAHIRICTACVLKSRQTSALQFENKLSLAAPTAKTSGSVTESFMLSVRVRGANESRTSTNSSNVTNLTHLEDEVIEHQYDPSRESSSSSDSNFSISSESPQSEVGSGTMSSWDRFGQQQPVQQQSPQQQPSSSYQSSPSRHPFDCPADRYDTEYSYDHDDDDGYSVGPGAYTAQDAYTVRDSLSPSERSSTYSFSDYNTLDDISVRITSVVTNKQQQECQPSTYQPQYVQPLPPQRPAAQAYQPQYVHDDRQTSTSTYQPQYVQDDRNTYQAQYTRETQQQQQPLPVAYKPQYGYHERESDLPVKMHTLYVPEDIENKTPNQSERLQDVEPVVREARSRSHSQNQRSNLGEQDSKCSSSSGSSRSSSSSLLDLLASIRDMKADLSAAQGTDFRAQMLRKQRKNDETRQPDRYLQRLSEIEQELISSTPDERPRPSTKQLLPTPLPPASAASVSCSAPRTRPRSNANSPGMITEPLRPSEASTVDIDMLNSDSFNLLCPENLMRGRYSNQQDAGERRTRVSMMSTSTLLEDVEDDDGAKSMRQSELAALRSQVEALHRSLQDATTKLNHYEARSMVQQHMDTLERDVRDFETGKRRTRRRSSVTARESEEGGVERKQMYHALISELHEIMGLPAIAQHDPVSSE